MDIKKLIEQPKWWAEECDRTNKGCQARRILQDAATAFSTLQAENEKLRYEVERVAQKYETAVKLQVKMTEISNRQMAELEHVKRERDAAIKRLRKIDWCAGCKDFCGLDGCAGVGMENCTGENDHYQFGLEEG